MSGSYIISGESVNGATVGSGQTLTILPGGSISGATVTGGVDSVFGSAQGSVLQDSGVEYVFTGGISENATLTGARQVLEQGTAPDVQTTVQGGNAPIQTFLFTDPDGFSLAQAIANTINAQSATNVQTYDNGGLVYPSDSYVLVNGPAADGIATIVGTSNFGDYILNSTGAALFAAAGSNINVAAAGGNNTIGTGTGSTYDVDTGDGNDVIYANGSGSVDAGAGTNTVILGTGNNIITSYGNGDLIAAGSGTETVSEGGTDGTIFLGSGVAVVADSGTSDTVIGGTGADTMFGGSQGTYFLGTGSNLFVASTAPTGSDTIIGSASGGTDTVFGGTSDVVFAGASSLTYIGGADGGATISGGAGDDTVFAGNGGLIEFDASVAGALLVGAYNGNSTIDASLATAAVQFEAERGSSSFVGGSGNDLFVGGAGTATFTGGAGNNSYDFIKGVAGGSDLITDFKSGDIVILTGYGANEVSNALATATETGDIETITLADNTKVSFVGDPDLSGSSFQGNAVSRSGQGSGTGTANVIAGNVALILLPVPAKAEAAAPLPTTAAANGTAVGTVIGEGGEQDVKSGSVAENTLIHAGGVQYVGDGGYTDNATIAGGAMSLAGGAIATTQIVFDGAGGSLSIAGDDFTSAPIVGFIAGDSITLSDIAYDEGGSVTLNADDTELVIREDGTQFGLAFDGAAGETFSLASADGGTGSIITEDTTVPCFLPGTHIRTPAGETLVEDLKPGDQVQVHEGGSAPVIWVGRREIETASHLNPEDVMPVLIAASAFSTGVPGRDLMVSPDHAMYFDGRLIPARSLINGFTIRQVPRTRVTYIHVELERHSLLWAEGSLTESFLECGNRAAFDIAGPVKQLFPAFNDIDYQAMRIAKSCAPFSDNGPVVHEVRRRLLLQAQIPMTRDHGMAVEYDGDQAIIRSRIAVPGHTELDPGDKRGLGVKIGALTIDGKMIPLDHPLLRDGWHAAEADGRWTNGHAVVPAELLNGSRNLDLTLTWTTLYPLGPDENANSVLNLKRRGSASALNIAA